MVYCTSLISLTVVIHFMLRFIKITQIRENSNYNSIRFLCGISSPLSSTVVYQRKNV